MESQCVVPLFSFEEDTACELVEYSFRCAIVATCNGDSVGYEPILILNLRKLDQEDGRQGDNKLSE